MLELQRCQLIAFKIPQTFLSSCTTFLFSAGGDFGTTVCRDILNFIVLLHIYQRFTKCGNKQQGVTSDGFCLLIVRCLCCCFSNFFIPLDNVICHVSHFLRVCDEELRKVLVLALLCQSLHM